MLVILESLSAGLIMSLISNYLIYTNTFDKLMAEREEEDDSEVASVVTGVSDSSTLNHALVYYSTIQIQSLTGL